MTTAHNSRLTSTIIPPQGVEELDFYDDPSNSKNAADSGALNGPEAGETEPKNGVATHGEAGESNKNNISVSHKNGIARNNFGLKSKVVHCRNLPERVEKREFVNLMLHFGHVTHAIFMKSQAFVEMSRDEDADNMVAYCQKYQLVFEGRKVFVQYSQHQKLRKNENHSNNNRLIQVAISYLWDQIPTRERAMVGSSVILIDIENMIYPVDLVTLYTIYAKYGKVLKMRILPDPGTFKALVQMENPLIARDAVKATDKQNIYSDANFLNARLVKMFDLLIKPAEKNAVDLLKTPVSVLISGKESTVQLDNSYRGDRSLSKSYEQYESRNESYEQPNHRHASPTASQSSSGHVVLIARLPTDDGVSIEQRIDDLFTIFSTVGVVQTIKVFYKDHSKAFVQYASSMQARDAIDMLHMVPYAGRQIYVSASHVESLIYKNGDDPKFFRDFHDSKKHRFIGKNARHMSNIFPPSNKIHISNIKAGVTRDELMALLKEHKIEHLKYLDDKHMAFVELESVEAAIKMLLALHGTQLQDYTIKLSFARES